MALDIYRPQTMLRIAQTLPTVNTFIKDIFFTDVRTFYTKSVTFDIRQRSRARAPFVHEDIGESFSERKGFKTKQVTPPLIAHTRILTGDDIDRRLPDEAVFNGKNPNRRRAELLRNDLAELAQEIHRSEEWMAAKALFEGKIKIEGEGVDFDIDFEFDNFMSAPIPWDKPEAKPFDDIMEASIKAGESGYSPNIMLANSKTLKAFLNNKQVLEWLDNSGLRVGIIEPQVLRNGGQPLGFLRQAGVDVYAYDSIYYENGQTHKYIPDGKVFIGSTNMPALMLYGVIHNERGGSTAAPLVPNTYYSLNGKVRYVSLASRPLPVPVDTSSWVILDVLNKKEKQK